MSKQVVMMKQGQGETLHVLGAQVTFLCEADKTDRAWSLMEVVLPKHAGPPPHDHPWDEAYYVVNGQVKFLVGGKEQMVGAGEFLYTPGGTLHGFQGASDDPARVLIFDAPAHAESFFREVDREVKGPQEFAKVPAIGAKHQINFMRP
ncbi:Mannose-6-phosphate isomerase, cupin superfamily [Noviherbaspirillum humi]|uniref:Mannose-6-phosphate isomerase, cupin superfamily n=1 Tax=Noviherbaspirillum humi TaxID=1688639 RepID=A0A239BUZ9_9BURK|nr:cupin domain-containing protein [Noviherbaspirillum humi]SNS11730.1 Mannose-6-phosphate isomerase, cupin superfamily [Noviherbaspirillum humi]